MVLMRLFGWHGKQPEKPDKKQGTGQKPNGKTYEPEISQEERLRAGAMAKKLAEVKGFAEFCAKNNLGSPGQAFIRFYAAISQDPRVWDLEGKAENSAEDAGKAFSRTGFYGKLFMKCYGNPASLTNILFKQ